MLEPLGMYENHTMTDTAETDSNRQLVRRAFDAWSDGSATITELFAPDMVWRIEGHSAGIGRVRQQSAFIDEVLAPFGARFAAGERFRPIPCARSMPTVTPWS